MQLEVPEACNEVTIRSKKISLISSVRAAVQIRRRYRILKTKCRPLDSARKEDADQTKAPGISSQNSEVIEDERYVRGTAQYFTFDETLDKTHLKYKRRKKHRKSKILFPAKTRKFFPAKEKSHAKTCLFLLCAIVFLQIFNAIENLDDNLQKYDLDGLEKTIRREVYGQVFAIETTIEVLRNYLSTHIHNRPLLLSFNGPTGVGKSHVGRLLAKHFRSAMESENVLQYYVSHQCPEVKDTSECQEEVSGMISELVAKAELEEKIAIFIFDDVESMPVSFLDMLDGYFLRTQNSEFNNAIYILISSIDQDEVTKFVLQNTSREAVNHNKVLPELVDNLRASLIEYHPLWKHAEIVPFTLLEKAHVVNCFIDEMEEEGFYPDPNRIERLASQLKYYSVGDRKYSVNGCKPVVTTVNLL